MNTILSVNYIIPTLDSNYIPFNSITSLSDADIILFNPTTNSAFQNSNDYWRKELDHILNLGKTVFVLLENPFLPSSYYSTPQLNIDFVATHGIKVYPKAKLVESFYNSLKDYWDVRCYLKGIIPENALFSSKNNDRILGAIFKVSIGHIIFIPYLHFQGINLRYPNNEWNEIAIEIGNKIIKYLTEIHAELNFKIEISPRPDWADSKEFDLKEVNELTVMLKKNTLDIQNLTKKNDLLLKKIKSVEILKDLLFETGKQLEKAVLRALTILGYSAENYDDGILELDQVILSPEGDRFIGECEGKDNKAIDVTKFRQLSDNLNEDFARENVSEKAFGLLFGNPQRLVDPTNRDLDFTEKCKSGAKRESIGLITTYNLFKVVRYLAETNDISFQMLCRKAIKDQLGGTVDFPDLPRI